MAWQGAGRPGPGRDGRRRLRPDLDAPGPPSPPPRKGAPMTSRRRAVVVVAVISGLVATVLAPAALAARPFGSAAARLAARAGLPRAGASPEAVLSCRHQPAVVPRSFVITCADVDERLTGLSWRGWQAGAAVGTGRFAESTCAPTCAVGHEVSHPALVQLTGALQTSLGAVLTELDWRCTGGRCGPPGGHSPPRCPRARGDLRPSPGVPAADLRGGVR